MNGFVTICIEDPELTGGKSIGEACTAASECASGLICKDKQDDTGAWTLMECAEMDDPYTGGKSVGEACSVSIADDCADGLIC
jgi:hypothetical protein